VARGIGGRCGGLRGSGIVEFVSVVFFPFENRSYIQEEFVEACLRSFLEAEDAHWQVKASRGYLLWGIFPGEFMEAWLRKSLEAEDAHCEAKASRGDLL
jgi:hypothetical protein